MKKTSIRRILNSAPVVGFLSSSGTMADNRLQQALEQLSFKRLLSYSRFRKQKGDSLTNVMFALIIWPLLDVRSISNFCGRPISVFIKGGKNVLYDFLKRDDLAWKNLRMRIAKQIYLENRIDAEPVKMFVFDDSLKHRRGKKVEGSSVRFDHTINKHVQAHQVMEMGLVSPKGYLPIDSQIVIGGKKTVYRRKPFNQKGTDLQDDCRTALDDNKNGILRKMLKRTAKAGLKADYVLADAWFGNKGNIAAVLNAGLNAIFRMKDSQLKYRFSGHNFTARALYHLVRHYRKPDTQSQKLPWTTWSIDVELLLPGKDRRRDRYETVKLVFSIPRHQTKGEFALFLSTDNELSSEKILEFYALRWGIEVYFKEVKQYMGFLKEQTGSYVCHCASVHLAAIRYLLLSHMQMQESNSSFVEQRKDVSLYLEQTSYASMMWALFKLLIGQAMESFRGRLGDGLTEKIADRIDNVVRDFLAPALQLDRQSFLEESYAEAAGVFL